MADYPVIRTAIPKRRYRVGDQSVTVLGEVESGDGIRYRWIMAFVQDGQARPGLYVCAEKERPGGPTTYRLRVVNAVMSEVVDRSDSLGDLDHFAEEGLRLGKSALGLSNEAVARLM
jgi:hypothetical protein